MKKEIIISAIFFSIITIWNVSAQAELLASEQEALTKIMNSLEKWKQPLEKDVCVWTFVTCDESHITELDLSEKGFKIIPQEIEQLKYLVRLDLSLNGLETLPEAIGSLTKLTELSLSMNKLTTLPDSFGKLVNLIALDLSFNQLHKCFPEVPQNRQMSPDPTHPPLQGPPLTQFNQLTKLKTLKLSGNQLEQLPFNLNKLITLETLYLNINRFNQFPSIQTNLSHLIKLDLSENEVSVLPENLNTYPVLQDLNLSTNLLDSISDNISQLTALISLSLTGNIIKNVSPNLGSLEKLKKLALADNNISSLPDSISQLEALTILSLEENALTSLPQTLGTLEHLISLSLNSNQLEELPNDFGFLVSLVTLNLDDNLLKELPDSFGKLKNLEWLDLSINNLKVLPDNFYELSNLLFLDLSQNKLEELSENFSQLKSLQTLILSSNILHALPSDFGSLRNLRYLYASSNAIEKTLCESFGNLQSIQEVDLSDNKLSALPDSFGNIDTLQTLNLSSNHLEALPYSFGKLTNLQTVDLSNNRIQALKADFGNLSFLSYLDLSNNGLKNLPAQTGGLESLTYLDLSHNEIAGLPTEINSLERLFTLNLNNNNITFLPAEFGGIKNLRTLLLKDNAFIEFPQIVLLLTDLLLLDLSNNPTMTGHIPFNFKNLDDLTDLHLDNTSLYTYSEKLANFINEKCRTCDLSPPESKKITSDSLILEGITSTTDELRYFKVDDVVDIVLMFNAPVKLEAGNLIVSFNTGYTSTISPFDFYTNTVSFTYTIHAGDNTEALNVSQIALMGGTLTDENGNHAILNLPVDEQINANLSSNKILPIDGVYPSVSITQPKEQQCIDTLDKIKGTAYDKFDLKEIEITVSSYTRTTKPAYYELIINEEDFSKIWEVDISYLEWEKEYLEDENFSAENIQNDNFQDENLQSDDQQHDNQYPEPFKLEENLTYTITVKVVDNVENESITQTTFTYKKKNSTISCHLSTSQITTGTSVTITGLIIPADSMISDVYIEMASDGYTQTKRASANQDGTFSYTTDCDEFHHAGLWQIRTIFNGGTCVYGSKSPTQPLIISKASTTIVLVNTHDAILNIEPFSIGGKLIPTSGCYNNLSGLTVQLHIVGVDAGRYWDTFTKIDQDSDFTENNIKLMEIFPNEDISGKWLVSVSFPETDSYSSSTSELKTIEVLESAGYAIIVQGKTSNEEGLASHQKTSDFVYEQFINRGLLDINDDETLNDIQYFSYASPGNSGYTYIDNAPSKELIKDAITVWAKQKMNSHPGTLYIVMVDHGLEEQFIIDDDVITSSELAAWQEDLYRALDPKPQKKGIVTILGFCHSGSFIDELSGPDRIVIASAAADEFSYKGLLDEDNIREGEYFIYEFFKKAALGKTIKSCFEEATLLTEIFTSDLSSKNANAPPYYDSSPQHPLLEDNADRVGSNSLQSKNSDGEISSKHVIGVGSLTTNDSYLTVTDVTETLFLAYDETPSDPFLWATVNDKKKCATIKVGIKSPTYSNDIEQTLTSSQKVMNLPVKQYDGKIDDRYFWNGSDIIETSTQKHIFDEPGIYQIFYYATDTDENVSDLKESIVYKNKADNQSPLPFSLISPRNDIQISTKGVLFDCNSDSDTSCYTIFSWEESNDPDDDQITYTLLLSKADDTFSNPDAHKMLQNNTMSIDLPDTWDGAVIYWKVQAIDQYGAIQESLVFHLKTMSVKNPDTAIIKGYVYDSVTNDPIFRAKVNLDNSMIRTSSRGYYHGNVEPKYYETIEVVAEDYKTQYLYSVYIGNGETIEQNIILEPESSDIQGDLNNDYALDLFDLIAGIQILANIENDTINIFADVDSDEVIGVSDILYIMNKLSDNSY